MCLICVGHDPATAEREFLARLVAMGATPLYDKWRGSQWPHQVRCAAGHKCRPRPADVQQGHGVCRVCVGKDPDTAEKTFLARLGELGATPRYTHWRGVAQPHLVQCAAGHECSPRPTRIQQGQGVCRICAGKDPAASERKFLARLAELGATPLYSNWQGSGRNHLVQCAAGHICRPRPGNVISGDGICGLCHPAGFNLGRPGLVYLVTHRKLCAHKIGIGAAGGARVREWRKAGWEVYKVMEFAVGADAHRVEQGVLRWFRDDLSLSPFLPSDYPLAGWTETVDASIVESAEIWEQVERLARE